MTTTKSKTINFKIEDMATTNRIMGQRGTMYIEVTLSFIDSDMLDSPEYNGDYIVKWSSSFSEESPHSISDGLKNEVIELLLNSYYDEEDAFSLDENRGYNLSHFEKYKIPYMVTHDCTRVEALIALATKSIIGAEITDEALDADAVDKLMLDIKSSFNKHEGNYSDEISESEITEYAKILENKNIVEFKHNGLLYEVFLSADSGFVVNLYTSDERDEDEELIEANMIDGGLCSGSAEDAIGFML